MKISRPSKIELSYFNINKIVIILQKVIYIHEAPCKFSDLDDIDFVELSGIKDTSKINENGP